MATAAFERDAPTMANMGYAAADLDALVKAAGNAVLNATPHFDPTGADEQGRLDQIKPITCPSADMSSSEAPARKPVLKLDWCSHAAAKYAVEHWHYSRRMPMPPLVSVGAWEDGVYVGCVLFSRGANAQLGAPYGLAMTECAELVRIALASHATPVTRIVAVALKFLRTNSPGLRLLVSYADPSEGHHGGIYQGGGWTSPAGPATRNSTNMRDVGSTAAR